MKNGWTQVVMFSGKCLQTVLLSCTAVPSMSVFLSASACRARCICRKFNLRERGLETFTRRLNIYAVMVGKPKAAQVRN